MVLHSEFRDGNVPAGFEQLRVFKEALAQPDLPGMELQRELPLETMKMGTTPYKVTAIVTNRDMPAEDLIWWSLLTG